MTSIRLLDCQIPLNTSNPQLNTQIEAVLREEATYQRELRYSSLGIGVFGLSIQHLVPAVSLRSIGCLAKPTR